MNNAKAAHLLHDSCIVREPVSEIAARKELRGPEKQAAEALAEGRREDVLTILMNAYGTAVYRYCLAWLKQPQVAEDLLQETFTVAFERLGCFAGRSMFKTWVLGIARNRCLREIKHRSKESGLEIDVVKTAPVHGADLGASVASAGMRKRVLRHCLDRLPPEKREALLLCHLVGLTHEEVGETVGARPAAVQMRIARAKRLLKACLEKGGVTP